MAILSARIAESTIARKAGAVVSIVPELENTSYVRAIVVENTNKNTLQPIIEQFVDYGSRVITDELNAYNGLSELGYFHAVVRHGVAEYANGDIFTNSIVQ